MRVSQTKADHICAVVDCGNALEKTALARVFQVRRRRVRGGASCVRVARHRVPRRASQVFLDHECVGACAGRAEPAPGWKLYNCISAASVFEMKVNQALDLPFESAFGFVEGCTEEFAAYR